MAGCPTNHLGAYVHVGDPGLEMDHGCPALIVLGTSLATAFTVEDAGDYVWEPIAPGGGGGVKNHAVSPCDADLLFAGSDMGGASWYLWVPPRVSCAAVTQG